MNSIGLPFVYRGATDVSSCRTSLEVMDKAGLNWDVIKSPIFAGMERREIDESREDGFTYSNAFFKGIDGYYSINRTDINEPLGVVKGRYEIIQNREVFNFIDSFIGKNEISFATAGCYGIGHKLFVSAKLPKTIGIGNIKDPIDYYLILSTAHDGTAGVKVMISPIRIMCLNQLNACIKQSVNYINIKHVGGVKDKLELANTVLKNTYSKIDVANEFYDALSKRKVTDAEVEEIIVKHVFSKDEFDYIINSGRTVKDVINKNISLVEDDNVSMKKVNTAISMNNYYHVGVAQQEIVGTLWGAYGAITGYYSNVDKQLGIKRFDSLTFGSKSKKIEESNKQLMAML